MTWVRFRTQHGTGRWTTWHLQDGKNTACGYRGLPLYRCEFSDIQPESACEHCKELA